MKYSRVKYNVFANIIDNLFRLFGYHIGMIVDTKKDSINEIMIRKTKNDIIIKTIKL